MSLLPYYVGVVTLTTGLSGAAFLYFAQPPLVSLSTAFAIINTVVVAAIIRHAFHSRQLKGEVR